MTYAFKPNRITQRSYAHPECEGAVYDTELECHKVTERALAAIRNCSPSIARSATQDKSANTYVIEITT
jgi:hypothetical protein